MGNGEARKKIVTLLLYHQMNHMDRGYDRFFQQNPMPEQEARKLLRTCGS